LATDRTDPTPDAGSDRNSRLDACRIFASIAILYMHTFQSGLMPNPGEIGRFGVPFFTSSAFYLLLQAHRRKPGRPFLPFLKSRFIRLYVPFLAWGLLGLLLMDIKHHFVSHKPLAGFGWGFFLSGDSFQLWYLPFLFVGGLLFFPVCSLLVSLPLRSQFWVAWVLIAGGVALSLLPGVPIPDPQSSWVQFAETADLALKASPAILLGLAVALLVPRGVAPASIGWLGLMFTVGSMLYVVSVQRNILIENEAGTALLLFAIAGGSFPLGSLWTRFAFLAYGIYLSQNVVLEPVQTLVGRSQFKPSVTLELVVFTIVLTLTTVISLLLSRSRLTRWLLG
jgi:fucose 4-O-acetylase-like acetyltransferase